MTTTLDSAVPVLGWDAQRPQWLRARSKGIGASDVAAILGFSDYRTPWQVWAEKVDAKRPADKPSAAADLGNDLEPWLIDKAAELLNLPVVRTSHQLYRHPVHEWRLCSPDAWVPADGRLVEAKTAGLASGFGPPNGWTESRVPLGYEFQCRWQMHCLDAPAVELVALVANLGVCHYTITRDLVVEAKLVAQVEQWWMHHVIGKVEPPLDAADNDALGELYPASDAGGVIELDGTEVLELRFSYLDARRREGAASREKKTVGAGLKRLLGNHAVGTVDGRPVVEWGTKNGEVDWQRMAQDLAQQAGVALPDPETYRKPASRSLTVKENP